MSDSSVLSWSVNGAKVDLDVLDITGAEWRDARLATDLRQGELSRAALIDKEVEAIAAFVWLALRRKEDVAYEAVLRSLTIRGLTDASG